MNDIINLVYLTPVGLLKPYIQLWTLASNTLLPHLFWCLPIACRVLIPITFRSSSTSSILFFPCPSSFPYFFHSGSHYFFWHSCCIHPFSYVLTIIIQVSDKFCSACPFKCILYLLIGSFASFLLLLWDHNFYHSIPLEQRFSNFFQVGTTFISQNVLRTTLLLGLSNSLGLP